MGWHKNRKITQRLLLWANSLNQSKIYLNLLTIKNKSRIVRNKDKTKTSFLLTLPFSGSASFPTLLPSFPRAVQVGREMGTAVSLEQFLLLLPHSFPLLQRESFFWTRVLQELLQHMFFPHSSVLQELTAPVLPHSCSSCGKTWFCVGFSP